MLLVLFLMAAYTAGYAWSAPHTDTADEILRAFEIRHGLAYPAEGPFLGGAFHFGPVWFYLTAVPMWISESWLAVALFIGFVCSLKFPLAYVCGRMLVDRDFGALWAAAMFVPGWATLEHLVFLNPNGVAMASLLLAAITLHGLREGMSTLKFAVLGLAMGFALHVHPTAVPFFLAAPLLLWAHHRRGEPLAAPIAAMTAGFAALFLPYVVSQVLGGYADWKSASTYMTRQVVPANVVNAPLVIGNYLLQGPAVVAEYFMDWTRTSALALGMVFAAAALTSLAVYVDRFAAHRARPAMLYLLVSLVLVAAWVACMRPTTPMQFTWVLGPPVAGLVAVGLWSLTRVPALRPVVLALVIASVIFNGFVLRSMARTVRDGEGRLPSRVMDIKGNLPHTVYRDVWFPALSHAQLGSALCAAPGPVSLHGHLGYVVDKDLGLDTLLACRDRSRFALTGSETGRTHFLGMTRPFWRALDWSPGCWAGSLGITRTSTPLAPRASIPLADGSTYLPRPHPKAAPSSATFTVTVPKRSAVLVTNVLGNYEYFEIVSAAAGGQPLAPIAANDLSRLYRPLAKEEGAVEWIFTVITTRAEAIDVVALENADGISQPIAAIRDCAGK